MCKGLGYVLNYKEWRKKNGPALIFPDIMSTNDLLKNMTNFLFSVRGFGW